MCLNCIFTYISEAARGAALRELRAHWLGVFQRCTCAAPVIMFGMKSLCPGASISVTTLDVVSNLVMPTSMVTPLQQTQAEERKNLLLVPILVQKKIKIRNSWVLIYRSADLKVLINFSNKSRISDWARRRSQTVPPKSLSVSAVFRFRFVLATITISREACVLSLRVFCRYESSADACAVLLLGTSPAHLSLSSPVSSRTQA